MKQVHLSMSRPSAADGVGRGNGLTSSHSRQPGRGTSCAMNWVELVLAVDAFIGGNTVRYRDCQLHLG